PETCRTFGPFGGGNVHSCSAILGTSRLATAQAEGALKMRALCPEISALLLDASSQAKTLSGRNGASFLNHAKTPRTASFLTVMLPFSSTSCAPWLLKTAPVICTASLAVLRGMPKGTPAL